MKLHKDSQGFAVTETILILVIVGLLAFVSWYVWHSKQNTEDILSRANTSAQSTPVVSKKAKSNSADAIAVVKLAYSNAAAYIKQTTNADQGQIDAAKNQLSSQKYASMSADYKNNLTEHDPFTCAQADVPSYDISIGSVSNGVAVVKVKENFKTPIVVTYKVNLPELKITDIVCPSAS